MEHLINSLFLGKGADFMLEEYPIVLIPDEACEVLRIGKSELYSLLNSNQLKGYRVGKGKNWRIPRQSVIEFVTRKYKK